MYLSFLQRALEMAPIRMKNLIAEIQTRRTKAEEIEFFLEAVRLLRVSWKDKDPGKYMPHWHGFKGGQKAWPRELINTDGTEQRPSEASLCAFGELDCLPCPQCEREGLDIGCYHQTEDGPSGDTWTTKRFVLCTHCVRLSPTAHQESGRRL